MGSCFNITLVELDNEKKKHDVNELVNKNCNVALVVHMHALVCTIRLLVDTIEARVSAYMPCSFCRRQQWTTRLEP